ncbi:MAG: hypothetical protein PHS95_00930 [Candidatus Pacebacteria bacterium]|nr:hypothetical protein [Candidatus Paceibacterota bacterium]
MIYLIYGNDRAKGLAKFQSIREKLVKNGTQVETIKEGSISGAMLDEIGTARGLFDKSTLFIFESILEKKTEQELLASYAEVLEKSANSFLVFEPSFDKELVKEVSKYVTEIIECSAKKFDARPAFNIFSLGDALGKRNKKELWVLFQQAVSAGATPEEIAGTLFWSVKNMALIKMAEPRDDAGLNPFVAKKTRTFAKNYSEKEIADLSRNLMALYHEAHRGGEPMNIALEKFILSLN